MKGKAKQVEIYIRNQIRLHAGHPELPAAIRQRAIADAMGVPLRSLQRQMEGEGLSCHQILDGIRKEMAPELLKTMTVKEASARLGFECRTGLCGAHRRWFNTNPRGSHRGRPFEVAP